VTASPTRLLAGLRSGRPLSLAEHLAVHGPLPALDGPALIDAVARAGLLGRGGAGFPTGRKLGAVATRRGPKVIVANGVEAEPMSAKDRVLLSRAPHLVLDGIAAAAMAVGAREAIVCVPAAAPAVHTAVHDSIRERDGWGRLRIRIAPVPSRYLAGEETALVRHLDGGPLKPTFTPPRPFERGVGRRPTLVQNVETLAHLALVARHGPRWFREVGVPTSPGTMLLTLSGAVRRPGVVEVPGGARLVDALALGGGSPQEVASLVIGGYFGAWLSAPAALALALDESDLSHHGAAVGAGVITALPASACGVAELTRVMSWLAAQSARQCGPCANGLPAIAGELDRIAAGQARPGAREHVTRWAGMVQNRGACRHPDGAVRLLASALRTLDAELRDHERHGPCEACTRPALLATPTSDVMAV
jgi:NADH:ubiquinone oxidoreductase subunit F (NADH-binding)